jgi:hypothetical protein
MRNHDIVLMMAAALSTVACVSSTGPLPERLYPPTAQPLRADQVSTLSGYVQFVDGKDVSSRGTYFELLPGCHLIGTPSHWGEQSPAGNAGATAVTGEWSFVLPMRAGYLYRIDVKVGDTTSPVGSLTIKGYESDANGKDTREFERSTSPKDIEACQAKETRP